MVTKKGGIPGVEFALGTTASGENNYLEWHLTVTGPVRVASPPTAPVAAFPQPRLRLLT